MAGWGAVPADSKLVPRHPENDNDLTPDRCSFGTNVEEQIKMLDFFSYESDHHQKIQMAIYNMTFWQYIIPFRGGT